MNGHGNQNHGIARRLIRVGLAAAVLGSPATVHAGEGLAKLSTLLGRKPAAAAEAKSGAVSSQINWWSIPRPARVAAKDLAAKQDATVSRCVAVEHDDRTSYEIHASRRLGLFKRSDFILTTVSEPSEVAEQRRQQQSLRGRLKRLRDAATKEPTSTGKSRSDFISPVSN
ncbi:MAG: hypothetical protein JWN86_3907 [Planctomycetota bacterium]|nr:hypothetical protein [Planctomycetota bacterium]